MSDRNFDDIAEHFERKVHNSIKGALRRAIIKRDLQAIDSELLPGSTIADLGAGLGEFSRYYATRGYSVVYNDISTAMFARALALCDDECTSICWHHGPYQSLLAEYQKSFRLVLCHALLEWLAEPELLLTAISDLLQPRGLLSLCVYNSAGRDFRNLICGNFNQLDRQYDQLSNPHSLTPSQPPYWPQIERWLNDAGFALVTVSGIRVFSDYATNKRGGLCHPEAVFERELAYSAVEPFKWLGRYLHVVARKIN
ncbi:MAG: methyltransferase domain-containing protein [Gammaproteobacteria bacterium]|nr:methyltransferase domain-containing protein [Gammaproteobacteria bacterium]